MKLGYARVSTDDQHLNLQLDALHACGCDSIYSDHGLSGTRVDRPGLRDALVALGTGDTLVIWKLDRLGRSLAHLISVISDLDSTGVRVVSLTEAIDTRSPSGKFMFHLIGGLAEFERALVSERTRAGLTAARERGRRGGRPPSLDAAARARAHILLQTEPEPVVAQVLGVSRVTLRRALAVQPTCTGGGLPDTAEPQQAALVPLGLCPTCSRLTGSGADAAPGSTWPRRSMPRKSGTPILPGTSRIGLLVLNQCALCPAGHSVLINGEDAGDGGDGSDGSDGSDQTGARMDRRTPL